MKLFILIFLLFTIQIFSHHTGGGGDFIQPNNNRFVDPFTGKREKPNDYFLFNYEMLKGERENRNIHTSTIFAEKILADGMFGLNFSAPFIYYEQKNRSNAGRYGKPYIGVKYLPLFNVNSSYILILETRLGFPSGKNGNRFAGGNYYVGITNFTAGYNLNRFTLVGKISGQFPLSGQGEIEKSENDGIPYPLRPQSDYFKKYLAGETQLKKVSIYSIYLNIYLFKYLSIFGGFLYRTPYEGIEKTLATGDKIPLIFREASAGFSVPISEKYFFTIAYRQPLNRGKEFRIYESAYNISFMMEY